MLKCISAYKADRLSFGVGDVIDNPALEAHLLNDSPKSFEVVKPDSEQAVKVVESAPADKMIKSPAAKKAVKPA